MGQRPLNNTVGILTKNVGRSSSSSLYYRKGLKKLIYIKEKKWRHRYDIVFFSSVWNHGLLKTDIRTGSMTDLKKWTCYLYYYGWIISTTQLFILTRNGEIKWVRRSLTLLKHYSVISRQKKVKSPTSLVSIHSLVETCVILFYTIDCSHLCS